jgi:methyltransferase (TIGR00027 family)
MKSGRVSQTALKVGLIMITLNEKAGWKPRLPEGLVELTERLILATDVFGYGPRMISVSKKPWVIRLSNYFETKMPGAFEGIGERKIFMNEQVLAAIEVGATQVLVVGAGFDTLCLRLAPQFPHIQFFEVDHPATSAAKAKGVAQEGQPENMTLLAADLNKTPLSILMKETERWDTGAQSAVVAEGLLLYLEEEEVLELFREVAACTGPGTRIAFSHGVAVEEHWFANAMLRVIGEPWLSSCASADLPEYIGPGWSVIAMREARSKRDLEGFAVAQKL